MYKVEYAVFSSSKCEATIICIHTGKETLNKEKACFSWGEVVQEDSI